MAVSNDTLRIDELLVDANRQRLVLPNFQREYVWALEAQKRLLASVLSDIPIGAVLLLRGQPDDYVSRRVASMQDATPMHECLFLLDGQQRLSTLSSIFASPFSLSEPWRAAFDLLPAKLRYVWSLRVIPEDDEEDIFGYRDLTFPGHSDLEPEDLIDFVTPSRILVKDEENPEAWFHPNWRRDLVEPDRNVERSRIAADKGVVPLWALISEDKARLVDTTLQIIAGQRRVTLRAGVDFAKRPELYEALRRAYPTLPSKPKEASDTEIESAFTSLAERWRTAMSSFILGPLTRSTSAILLQRDDVGRAVAIFEVINQGGTPLTPFDLTVAKNARHPEAKNLSRALIRTLQDLDIPITQAAWFEPGSKPLLKSWSIEARNIGVDDGSLTTVFKNAFLNLLSLRYHALNYDLGDLEVSQIKRKAILSLQADDIAQNWRIVAEALLRAWSFLQVRCGVVSESDLRYKLMILPLAYVIMQCPEQWEEADLHNKFEYWYWTALFGGIFRERQNENAISEVKALYDWCTAGSEEVVEKMQDRRSKALSISGYSDLDALILKDKDAAIGSDVSYAVLQYVLSQGPMDFAPDSTTRLFAWQDVELEDHHVIPLGSAASLKASATALRAKGDDFILNSPLNRTLISRSANRAIGSKTPGQYWAELAKHQPASHLLPTAKELYDFDLDDFGKPGVNKFLEERFSRIKDKLDVELLNLLQGS